MKPRYEYGDEVRLTRNVRNDGTYPGKEVGELLIQRGATGVVYDVGTYLQDQLIYRVHFIDAGKTVGCREEELIPVAQKWIQNRFEFRDKVQARCALQLDGEVIARKGDIGEIENVLRDEDEDEIFYNLYINGCNIMLPERALAAATLDGATTQEHADEIQH
ncbi:nitrogen fixation protein NifZ [Marinobacterium sp. D7]|uniref:nitrogen fixation protein NifZ n=1 Tax=Marinobacterium ramblicola TaxID=2849041 RepID=UPI001C2DB23A|nr:nitrogen fixation protein NifZ [Marinobacterium ramblicola]MBV1789651.1 nitrogen fixation protein NifZ [Marinobacterium ramblicola]